MVSARSFCVLAMLVALGGCRPASEPVETPAPTVTTVLLPSCCTAPEQGDGRFPDPATSHVEDSGKVIETVVAKIPPPRKAPEGMVWIPGGKFSMGTDYGPFGDARPIHTVELSGYYMDAHAVTNAEFAKFVKATHYVTVAERPLNPRDFPGVDKSMLVPGAIVFTPPTHEVPLNDAGNWWRYVPGANWKNPEGPGSDLKGREKHPVVQVAWDDAVAYAKWAGKRLPTEAEFEFAARGGATQKPFVWGDTFCEDGKLMANTFQGHFPDKNTKDDGYERTSPVDAFPPNGFGLYDMAGNVWNWCSDWYRNDYYKNSPAKNPQGPKDSFDPEEPGVMKRVQRGGSFLCTDQFCSRYMPGGRGKGAPDTGSSHIGFRCVIGG